MDIRVLGGLVWLVPEKAPDRDPGTGLYLPPRAEGAGDDGKLPPITARVVAVGPGRRLAKVLGAVVEPQVRVGDRVLVGAYEGARLRWDGRDVVVVREEAIHGVIEEDG